ncbi:MAG TPA: T9SS type A sorting domain-containing protein [Chitinophaga sp.]|nr:T9SS type A sorting domain-containing protein [Chitinophaga sp.]
MKKVLFVLLCPLFISPAMGNPPADTTGMISFKNSFYGYSGTLPVLTATSRDARPGRMYLYPVPSTGTVYVETTGTGEEDKIIGVFDMTGKAVLIQKYGITMGYNRLEVPLPSTLANGTYIISDGTVSKKIVLAR